MIESTRISNNGSTKLRNRLYYYFKPFIPRTLQIIFRRQLALRKRRLYKDVWPVDERAGKIPYGWAGWPDQKKFALVLTHDVESAIGHEKCLELMIIEEELGFRSTFNFVPERYKVSSDLRECLTNHGFEVGLHGLNHDGKLYKSEELFKNRAARINQYLKEWNAVGFRSPSMHHNLNWLYDLNIEYDSSTFDTDPFEPQPEGIGTIFPFFVQRNFSRKGYVELPYTLPQDFTLFVLMKERNVDIWKQKLEWIVQNGGMALMNCHPDYMNFDGSKLSVEEYSAEFYVNFLEYVKTKYEGQYWHALPKEMAHFWLRTMVNKKALVNPTFGIF